MSPRPRSAGWLAARFEVDARTIRRDINALQEAGVPIYAEPGRRGGYVVDRSHTLPPVNITPREAVAAAIALRSLGDVPFLDDARSVLHKLVAAMAQRDVEAARRVAHRIHLAPPEPAGGPSRAVLRVAEDALVTGSVLAIEYVDRHGAASHRLVEPAALLGGGRLWYLVGWCRLRGGEREFRLDRMRHAAVTMETAPRRPVDPGRLQASHLPAAPLTLL